MDNRTEITGEKMDELRRLAEAATPGPWACELGTTNYPECDDCDYWAAVKSPNGRDILSIEEKWLERRGDDRRGYADDAAYIAACSPDVILALLDRASSPARSAEGMVTDEMIEAGAKAHYERQVLVGVVDEYFATIPWEKLDPSYTSSYRKAVRVILNAALSLSTQPGTEAEAGEPVAWRCYDKVMGTWSVTDSAELVNSRARRPQDWIVEPLYDAPPSLASRVQELEKALRDLERFWRGRVWQGVTAQDQEDIDAAFAALNTGTKP